MIEWWQHLPETLDPIAFTIGFFTVYWYALFFLSGFFIALLIALLYARRGDAPCPEEDLFDVSLWIFFGALLGGRIGYVLFYNLEAFVAAPLRVFLPYDFTQGIWVGIAGMSYHGGLIGALLALLWYTCQKRLSFWKMADFVLFLASIATFCGRLGNFFNVELYGRVTDQPWGMIFPGVAPLDVLRHPSTLYEAGLEGAVLFLILLFFRKRLSFSGALTCLYLAAYALFRFLVEFFRSPDPQLGFFFGVLTLGQLLSLMMLMTAGILFLWLKRKNYGKIMP